MLKERLRTARCLTVVAPIFLFVPACMPAADQTGSVPSPESVASSGTDRPTTTPQAPPSSVPTTGLPTSAVEIMVEQLDERVESVSVDGQPRTVLRFIDDGATEVESLAAIITGVLSSDDETGCYGIAVGSDEKSLPVVWPRGMSLAADGSMIGPDGQPILVGDEIRGEGGEVTMSSPVSDRCGSRTGYEFTLLDQS